VGKLIEKGKISSLQMAVMMNPAILATAILLVPAITAKEAKQDLWMVPFLASAMGFFGVYIAHQLNKRYPKQSIIECSQSILGFIPGKILGLIYVLFLLHITSEMYRQYAEFIIGNFLIKTPMFIIIGCMIMVSAFAVRGGIEVIGRTSQIFVPVVIFLFLMVIIFLIPDMEFKKMFPILENGLMPPVKASITPMGWFSEFALITFLLPFLSDREKGLKLGMLSVISVSIILVIVNFASLFVFGTITETLTYPVMSAARYISIADFFEHLESIIMAIWVLGIFIKVSVFYYVLVLAAAQWLNLSDYRPLVLPFGLLLVTFAFWSASNLQELARHLSTTSPFYLLTFFIMIPVILLMIAFIRRKQSGHR
jgi:spore germination protein KB